MVYYLGRHIEILFDREAFLKLLQGDQRVFAVLSAGDYDEIARDAGVPTCVLDRRPTVNIKLKAVLARDPLPEVLLITNRCDHSHAASLIRDHRRQEKGETGIVKKILLSPVLLFDL